ncbi:MAG TPA: hypothetical protein VNR36_06280 [Pseudolysinimonas sp.]|nr:hypothetical protein [Pseudolysinimonas sp.]
MALPVRILFLVHGIATAAAGVVLVVAPNLIPSTVGIVLAPEEFLLPYLLAGAELALAVLSFGALQMKDPAAIRLIALVFAALHVLTAGLELLAPLQSPVLLVNAAVRVVVAVLFVVVAWPRRVGRS